MKELERLYDRIIQRVNINLRELEFDVKPFVWSLVPPGQMTKFYAFYGISPHHPLSLQFRHCGLAGSYFLGKCRLTNSLLYKSDIRGDELKKKGDVLPFGSQAIEVTKNEEIFIENSALIKTLVHNFSHDPETPETFFIQDTVSIHYANIHGAPSNGCFLGPFATVDLTTMRDCVIGAFSYIQAGEINHLNVEPGTIWVRSPNRFNFLYRFPEEALKQYISFSAGSQPKGILIDFMKDRKEGFQKIFDVVNIEHPIPVPASASLDRYAVVNASTRIAKNVLVSQRAFLQNANLGEGANAQENCFIINSNLEGFNVTAHGAKIIETNSGRNVFVGFNCFLRGRPDARITIGEDCIIMPHTIIDIKTPLTIPEGFLVWGLIRDENDLKTNSVAIETLSRTDGRFTQGELFFEGNGSAFVTTFQDRIHHILEANGAFFDGKNNRGHAQKNQDISFNTIQPYPTGGLRGLYPTILIQP